MTRPTVTLYTFLGVHSFLIGLFPFYIPVFLYKNGFSLSRICAFIAVTALGFVITLYPWERMARQVSLTVLILVSFFSELLLMTALFIENEMVFIIIAGSLNGVFNCHFWMISLFLIVQQNYWKLGLLVVVLALFFGLLFILIKNRIDRLPAGRIYTGAVCLYSLSWLLRGLLSETLDNISMLLMLAVITFCTSLFRLVFNKRFYDIAAATTGHAYIFMKSYISQFFLAAGAMSGVLWLGPGNTVAQLSGIYLAAAALSFVFLLYHLEKR